ncbi:MAG: hypothetical protein AB1305_04325 [Candidatus Hadarchaeota archaeon]
MPALRTLGLVIMASFVVSIGAIGYGVFQAVTRDRAATEAAMKVAAESEFVAISGGSRLVEISIPGGYQMRFFDNQIFIDNRGFQANLLGLRFSDNSPQLGSGAHTLSITVQENKVVVSRIS